MQYCGLYVSHHASWNNITLQPAVVRVGHGFVIENLIGSSMMQQTSKQFTFEAAHETPPFSGLHGHSFLVEVVLAGVPDPVFGWTHNLNEVEPVVDDVRGQLDHRYLNDIDGLSVPTLENVARWIWNQFDNRLEGLERVIVRRGQPGAMEGCSYSGRQ